MDKNTMDTTERNVSKLFENTPLVVKGLYKKYKKNKNYTIMDLNFQINKGEFHGFIGANGAGKTTTIKSLVGAYANFEGKVFAYGENINSIKAKQRIGYIPEKANFPRELSVFQYIWRMATLSGFTKQDAKKFAAQELKKMGLEKYMSVSPHNLSSGQKKKVLLVQALAHDPDLIIMDEPAANLDPKARSDFFNTLKKLQKKGKSIFMSSHILAELENFVDSVTILDGGKIVFSGKVEEIQKNNNFKYHINLGSAPDNKKFLVFAKKNKFETKKIDAGFEIVFSSKANVAKGISFIAKNKLNIVRFSSTKKSLQEVYNLYIKDTPAQEVKNA